ncbi:MAG: hypothetical protein IKP88_14285 [Lachnospiraceae bacterium]|nr:hypothetical protein [Lachnospiraceae bacterium]
MRKDIRFAICFVVIMLLVILCIYRYLADKEIESERSGTGTTGAVPTSITHVITDSEGEVILHRIRYYTIKLSQMDIETADAVIGENAEVTPLLICEYVSDSLEDEEIEITVKGAQLKDRLCIVDLGRDILEVSKKDRQLEKLILDALAMSIVDNCKDVEGVSFSIENQPYSSSWIKLESEEVYLKR